MQSAGMTLRLTSSEYIKASHFEDVACVEQTAVAHSSSMCIPLLIFYLCAGRRTQSESTTSGE